MKSLHDTKMRSTNQENFRTSEEAFKNKNRGCSSLITNLRAVFAVSILQSLWALIML